WRTGLRAGSAASGPGVGCGPGAAFRAAPRMAGCRFVLAVARHRGAGVLPPTACRRGALRPPVPGATASRSGSATVAPGVGRAPGGASRAAPAVPGYRSALAIAVHRGAGVFPPTAYMCGALRSTVSGAIASPFECLTAAPGAGRAPGGASRSGPCMRGCRSVLEITLHRGAGVFPPTAYTCDAFVPTVSGATASPRRSGTVVLATGRAPGGASRAALGKPGFLRVPETTALSPAGVLPPASCALGGASPIGPEAIASSPWSAITQLRGLEAVPATGCAPDVLGRVVQLRTGSPSASVTLA